MIQNDDPNKMGAPPAGMQAQPSIGDTPHKTSCEDILYVACVLRGEWPHEQDRDICARVPDLSERYVEHLYSMVSRYAPRNQPWRFVCFTDRPARLLEGIPTRKLPEGLYGWFSKLYLFSSDAFPVGSRVLYFDLDTAITGQLDAAARIPLDLPVALSNVWSPGHVGSGVLSFRAGPALSRIWSEFEPLMRHPPPYQHPNPHKYPPKLPRQLFRWGAIGAGIRTDEQWLHQYWHTYGETWRSWDDLLPGAFISYKHDIRGDMEHRDLGGVKGPAPKPAGWSPRDRGVTAVYFHGHPRPHRVVVPWNPHWREVMPHPQTQVGHGFVTEDWNGQ